MEEVEEVAVHDGTPESVDSHSNVSISNESTTLADSTDSNDVYNPVMAGSVSKRVPSQAEVEEGVEEVQSTATFTNKKKSNDYQLLYTLHQLVTIETQCSDNETDITEYRKSVKRLLQQLLIKFEETLEYQKYLEAELDRCVHCDEENAMLQEKVLGLEKKLRRVRKERDQLQQTRQSELKTYLTLVNKMNAQIAKINANFESNQIDEVEENDGNDDEVIESDEKN